VANGRVMSEVFAADRRTRKREIFRRDSC